MQKLGHLTPPGLVVGRCGAAAGAPSPPSYDRSETASSTGPPEDYTKVCHRSGVKRFPSHLHSCLVLSLRSRRSPFIVKVSLSDRLLEVRHTGLIKQGQTASRENPKIVRRFYGGTTHGKLSG